MSEIETISPEEFEGWLTPRVALGRLASLSSDDAKRAILKRAANGLISAAARDLFVTNARNRESYCFVRLAEARWQGTVPNFVDSFWRTGDWETAIDIPHSYPSRQLHLSFHEIRFDPRGIARLAQASAVVDTPPPIDGSFAYIDPAVDPTQPRLTEGALVRHHIAALPAPKHGGGRPAHPYWEEAILQIARQIHLGDFKPQRQADVSRALADWIVAQGHDEPGATQLKARAKLVFDLFGD